MSLYIGKNALGGVPRKEVQNSVVGDDNIQRNCRNDNCLLWLIIITLNYELYFILVPTIDFSHKLDP